MAAASPTLEAIIVLVMCCLLPLGGLSLEFSSSPSSLSSTLQLSPWLQERSAAGNQPQFVSALPEWLETSGEEYNQRIKRQVPGPASSDTSGKQQATTGSKTADPVVSKLASAFHLNNSHLHLMVHWAGKGSSVVFCLARDQRMQNGSTSQLYLSNDYGLTFEDVSGRFRGPDGRVAVLDKFYNHQRSICRYVFTDVLSGAVFTSTDCGKTIRRQQVDFVPSKITFDERVDDVFLVHDLMSNDKPLYVSEAYGSGGFRRVSQYVKEFFLEPKADHTTIYIQRFEPAAVGTEMGGTNHYYTTLLKSDSYFADSENSKTLETKVIGFQVHGGYLFMTKKASDSDHLSLYVSVGGERFVEAKFDLGRSSRSRRRPFGANSDAKNTTTLHLEYHITDVTEDGTIMVIVNHDKVLSNLYVSTRFTPHDVLFSLSLERVMFYNPNVTWTESWLPSTAGDKPFADVYKIQGLRGIYIASQLTHDAWNDFASGEKKEIQPEDLISLISFDRGGMWSKIKSPVQDERGAPLPCDSLTNEKCSLHLSQQLSKKFPNTRSIPILSSKSALGIVLATGNVGTSLKQKSNVYLSADAGLSWHQILKGSYYYNFGDHGGIIVAVKYFKTEGNTNELHYSTDEGISWKTITFYHKPLKIFGLLTEPGENTTMFTMFGTESTKNNVDWIILTVNLTSVFDHVCTADDYKRWSPYSDATLGKHRNCLLGRREFYERRSVKVNCYNGKDFERVVTVVNCGCDRSDYICDFGFKKDEAWSDACIKDDSFTDADLYAPPANCEPHKFYNQTRGYIKIRGDTCEGGKADRYEPQVIGCPLKDEQEFLLVAQRNSVMRMNLRNIKEVEAIPLVDVKNVIAIEYDIKDSCLFYGDIEVDRIFMVCNQNGTRETLIDDNKSVEGMAYDWVAKNLYFADGAKPAVEMVQIQHRGRFGKVGQRWRKVVLDKTVVTKPRGIAVHPFHGYLYYSDWNEANPHIGRAAMDGSGVTVLFKVPVVQWPNGLAIDFVANRLYWVDAQKDMIASCDLDGKDFKQVLFNSPHVKHPFSVGIHKDLMYWDDWNTKSLTVADKNTGKGVVTIMTNMEGAMDLKTFSPIRRTGNNSCAPDSNKCPFLCSPLPDPPFYTCLCPDGLRRKIVNNDPAAPPEEAMRCTCPDGGPASLNGTCPKVDGKCTADFQFSCASNHMCVPKSWVCDGADDCGDGSDELGCQDDPSLPPAAATEECNANQFMCGTVSKYSQARCIPASWKCDYDEDCQDGSDELNCNQTVCDTTTSGEEMFMCRSGQCIPAKWRCDRESDCQDGSDEDDCSVNISHKCNTNEFQCEEHNGQCLPEAWKCDGEEDCPNGQDEADCSNRMCKEWQFACSNGACIFSTWRCDGQQDCSDGSDEANCTEVLANMTRGETTFIPPPIFPSGPDCDAMTINCDGKCVPYWWRCDGAKDCADGSDEQDCGPDVNIDGSESDQSGNGTLVFDPTLGCTPEMFMCKSGGCIYQSWLCDGDTDCIEGEDESKEVCQGREPCSVTHFKCERSGECIDYHKICNGVVDCTDESDEQGCGAIASTTKNPSKVTPPTHCGADEFACDDYFCISYAKMCDGKQDCVDGSDEKGCQHDHVIKPPDLTANPDFVTSKSITVSWSMPETVGGDLQYQPSYSQQGSFKWHDLPWFHHDKDNMKFVFENLFPYTRYWLKMHIKYEGRVMHALASTSVMTAPDRPGPPHIISVRQILDFVNITWTPPSRANGPLRSYIVNIFEKGVDDFDVQGEKPFRSLMVDHNTLFVRVDGSLLKPQTKYSFTVVARNSLAENGEPSSPKGLVYDKSAVLSKVQGFGIEAVRENSVRLRWIKAAVVGDEQDTFYFFNVSIKSDNLIAHFPDLSLPKEAEFVEVTGLSPASTYTFSIFAVKDGLTGPVSRASTKTKGKPLPSVNIVNVSVDSNKGTSMRLDYKLQGVLTSASQTDYKYGIFYGLKQSEMGILRNETFDNSFVVHSLESCESYTFMVAVVGNATSRFYGLPSPPFSKETAFSPGAAPKRLTASLMANGSIKLEWEASCKTMKESIGYRITVNDQTMGSNKTISVDKDSGKPSDSPPTTFSHVLSLNVRFGTVYTFWVQTDIPDSKTSKPISIATQPLPTPTALTSHHDFNSSAHVVSWMNPALPLSMSGSYSGSVGAYLKENIARNRTFYTLKLTRSAHGDHNVGDDVVKVYSDIKTNYFELPMEDMEPGRLYYLSVRFNDGLGYSSSFTPPVAIETPVSDGAIVVSSGNAWGAVVGVLLVVCALGTGFGYYFVKHRRLRRNFQEWVSKYTTNGGGGALIVPHIDDDQNTPIIRAFNDEEHSALT